MGGGARFLGKTDGKMGLSLGVRRGIMGVKFSYWAKCNLIRMGQGGIWLNFLRLVLAALMFG